MTGLFCEGGFELWDREKTNWKQSLTNLDAILAKKVNFDACAMFMEVIMTCNCCNFPMFS